MDNIEDKTALFDKLALNEEARAKVEALKRGASAEVWAVFYDENIKMFLNQMDKLELTEPDRIKLLDCIYLRWRQAMRTWDPFEREALWKPEWYDLMVKTNLAHGDYQEAFGAALHSVYDYPLRSTSWDKLNDESLLNNALLALKTAEGDEAIENILAALPHAQFNGGGRLTTDFTGIKCVDDQGLARLQRMWHQTLLTILDNAHARTCDGEELLPAHVLAMIIRSKDRHGLRYGERIQDDTDGIRREHCLQWLEKWQAGLEDDFSAFESELGNWLETHTRHDPGAYVPGQSVEFKNPCFDLSQVELEKAEDDYQAQMTKEDGQGGSKTDLLAVVLSDELHTDNHRRVLTISDVEGNKATLTLWERHADKELQGNPCVIAGRHVTINTMKGKMVLSAGLDSKIIINPNHEKGKFYFS